MVWTAARLILEEAATTTAENFAFSRDLLTKTGVDRPLTRWRWSPTTSTLPGQAAGRPERIRTCRGRSGGSCPWVHLQINYYLREAFAMVKSFLLD